MKRSLIPAKTIVLAAMAWMGTDQFVHAQHTPIQPYKGKIGKTIKETSESWAEKKKAPAGAPNVVWILLDDVGYGAISTFGGLINTPTLDSLANNGLRYTNFHTTAICAPTRAALLTGRNSHSAHMGLFPETAIGTPGYDAQIPFEKATAAEILKENGYNTFALGKWHITPLADLTPAGPFNRWPTGRGFEHFYGFPSRGSIDQWHPELWEGTHRQKDQQDGKHFNELIANRAISYVSGQKAGNPDKPFFLYIATGAGHAPHQVAKQWSDKYKGKFDGGWDEYREKVLANQIKLGVVPKDAKLPPRNVGVKEWAALSADEKKLYARFMEIYAGFIEYTDYEIGRVISHLKESGQLENTLVFVSVGDNGASKEGTFVGTVNNYGAGITEEQRLKKNLENIDLIGSEFSKVNYPLGWAAATNVPFRQWKQDANSEGGTHNPLIVFYPKGIKEKGGIRNQYSHIIDLLPTTLELIQAKVPEQINGYKQDPIEGTSLVYSLNDAAAKDRHNVQYYEIHGSRAIYKDGWKAGSLHVKGQDFNADTWQLYNLKEDFNEITDLSGQQPAKLKELRALFDSEAIKYNVYPLKDGTQGYTLQTAYKDLDRVVLYPGQSTIVDVAGPFALKKSFSLIADVDLSGVEDEGVLLSRGGFEGGLSFFIQNRKLNFVYAVGDGTKYVVTSEHATLPQGKVQLRADVKYDENGAGQISLFANNSKVGESKLEKTTGYVYLHEGVNVGFDDLTPVADTYQVPFTFTGKINHVTIDYNPGQQSSLK
ncbi:arylsulfatase [Dyadobacter fanqingshengii]|uniref:Arylsulfatase n=1 Tax=Dyadobacter fanqingshengii TaxID=2906443 RepID=A0A9X1PF75_9BACT|nr:arylsulfatase [Dyadobacter fanqingshengii]MCF0042578.1 arylsulfatase [Dyadobacter fanqingshengii]USJ36195.1 arylsulfatase [Dyadobacter fanqingshengii]